MAEVLSITVPSSKDLKGDGGKAYTAYEVKCKYGDATWSVLKRYSQLLELKTTFDKDLVTVSTPFPKKGFGTMGAAALVKRREQLDAYMAELSGAFLPEHLYDHLCKFVEMKAHLAKHSAGGSAETPPPAPPAGSPMPHDAKGGGASSSGASSGGPTSPVTWDESFMSMDPLAGLLEPEAPAATAAPAAKPPSKPAAKPSPPPAMTAAVPSSPAPAAAPLPGFFGGGAPAVYPSTGEGLRDAIKDRNVPGVKTVLAANPKAALYQDRLGQTMLHLAAIFDHTGIAELLLDAGANPAELNSDKETAMDVAQPTLRRKLKAALDARP